MSITVIDVVKALGVEPLPELTWSVGNKVRDIYEMRHGGLPPKLLRTKTCGVGSHCFAIYPDCMFEEIANIVRTHQTEKCRQFMLPF